MKPIPKIPNIDIEPLYEITQGLEKGYLFFTAMELGIFDHFEKSKTAREITDELNLDVDLTVKFLNSLVAVGLLAKEKSLYCNTTLVAAYLVKGKPFYQGSLLNLMKKTRHERWTSLSQFLKKMPIQPEKKVSAIFDRSFILAMAEGAMRGGLHSTIEIISSLPEFKDVRKFLDLGGGHGLYAIGICQVNSKLQGFVFDLPPVIEVAREYIDEYGMNDKVHTISGDLANDDWGADYDIIFASDSLYKPKGSILPVLKRIRDSLSQKGIFICKHWAMNEDRTTPTTTVLWDLTLSLMGNPAFYTYSNEEFSDILKEAGFSKIELFDISTPSKPSKIIVARKDQC
jgi:SAM-dependent methyltransferase